MSTWVYAVNKFAEPSVRIQSERGHKVVDTGPYAIVRHPLYSVSFFLVCGIPLPLGSYWALLPVAVGGVVIVCGLSWKTACFKTNSKATRTTLLAFATG